MSNVTKCYKFVYLNISRLLLDNGRNSLPGYNISRCDRRDRIGGGVCLYIKDNIGFEELLNHSNSVCEALILRLKNPDLILVNIYRPPTGCMLNGRPWRVHIVSG